LAVLPLALPPARFATTSASASNAGHLSVAPGFGPAPIGFSRPGPVPGRLFHFRLRA